MEQVNQPTSSSTPSEDLVRRLCEAVVGSASWMKFLGVLLIINGVVIACTGIGLLICWLPIWLGVILFKAAGDAELASRGAPQKLMDFIRRINKFFLIEGILALIGMIIFLTTMFVLVTVLIWWLSGSFH